MDIGCSGPDRCCHWWDFWRQHIASQEPIRIYKPVALETTPKTPPPGETAENGHWHAEPHEPASVALPSRETQNDSVWYPENYTPADLAGKPAQTDEEYHRRVMKKRVNTYLREHREKYPDCTEHASVLADAKRQAEWILVDEKHMNKRRIHDAELDFIMSLYDNFREKYADTLFARLTMRNSIFT